MTFSPGLDSFRRYGLDRDVNWKNFVFSSDSAEYSQLSAEDHYQAIVSKLSYGSDLLGLRQCDYLPPRRIPRFQISNRAKNLIKSRIKKNTFERCFFFYKVFFFTPRFCTKIGQKFPEINLATIVLDHFWPK